MINAISDHYLHDFFAPGHVVTPRDIMNDVPATALHDRANVTGMRFQPAGAVHQLLEIFAFVCKGQLSWTQTRARTCPNLPPELLVKKGLSDELAEQEAAARILMNFSSERPESILLRGDGRLWEGSEQALAQRLWMLAINIRSILDVIEARDSFDGHYEWQSHPSRPPEKVGTAFGAYVTGEQTPVRNTEGSSAKAEEPASGSTKREGVVARRPPHAEFVPSFGFALHRESMSSGSRAGRNVGTLEFSPGGMFLFSKDRLRGGVFLVLVPFARLWLLSVHGRCDSRLWAFPQGRLVHSGNRVCIQRVQSLADLSQRLGRSTQILNRSSAGFGFQHLLHVLSWGGSGLGQCARWRPGSWLALVGRISVHNAVQPAVEQLIICGV